MKKNNSMQLSLIADAMGDNLTQCLKSPNINAYPSLMQFYNGCVSHYESTELYKFKGCKLTDEVFTTLYLFSLEESLQAINWKVFEEHELSLLEFYKKYFYKGRVISGLTTKLADAIASQFLSMLHQLKKSPDKKLIAEISEFGKWFSKSFSNDSLDCLGNYISYIESKKDENFLFRNIIPEPTSTFFVKNFEDLELKLLLSRHKAIFTFGRQLRIVL